MSGLIGSADGGASVDTAQGAPDNGGGGGGGGSVASAVPGLTFPVVAGTPTLTAAGIVDLPALTVSGNEVVHGTSQTDGAAIFNGGATINAGAVVNGTLQSNGGVEVDSGTLIAGAGVPTTLHDTLQVDGAATVNGGATINAGATVNGTLTSNGGVDVASGTLVAGAGVPTTLHDTLQVDGHETVNGGATINAGAAINGTGTLNGNPIAVQLRCDTVNVSGVELSAVDASVLTIGALAWVKSVGAYFQFQVPTTPLTVDHITVETASGVAGGQWIRLTLPNQVFAAVPTWHVDPVNGSDEAAGTGTGANALKTCAEWARRLWDAWLTTAVTVNLDNDIPDADTLYVPCHAGVGGSLAIVGAQTVVATDTVLAGTQARNAAANQANQINTTVDFSAFVNQFVRVQGSQNYAAITKAISAGTCRLSELCNTTTGVQAVSAGIAVGQIVEVVQTRKGPLAYTVVGAIRPSVTDVRFEQSIANQTVAISLTRATTNGSAIFKRVILGATFINITVPSNYLFLGGLFKTGAVTVIQCGGSLQCTAMTGTSFATGGTSYNKWRSVVLQGTTVNVAGPGVLHIDGDLGQFDTAAAAIGVNLSGTVTSGEMTQLGFNSGRHYGSGNNATANVWNVGTGCVVIYPAAAAPTQDAGNGVAIQGGNVAVGALPVNLSLTKGSAVYAQ